MAEGGKRPGPEPTDLDNEERSAFLDLLRGGFGIQMAMKHLGIGHRRYYRTIKSNKEFRFQVENAIEYDQEYLVYERRRHALGDEKAGIPADPQAIEYLIDRNDRGKRWAYEQREKRRLARKQSGDADEGAEEEPDFKGSSSSDLDLLMSLIDRLIAKRGD